MHPWLRNAVASAGMGAIIVFAACLGSLPDATVCPAPAVYHACTLVTTDPMTGACACTDGRDCSSSGRCKRMKSSCYPAPDCPPVVRQSAPGAVCLDSTPSLDLSLAAGLTCSCGGLPCAVACDGEGLVMGESQTLVLVLHNGLPSSGSLGLMVRARGRGTLTFTLSTQDGMQPSLGTVPLTADFSDSLFMGQYPWTTPPGPPTSIQLATDATPSSSADIDCVVPYLVP